MSTGTAFRRQVAEQGREMAPTAMHPGYTRAQLEPLLEGARARGMADAYELLGQAALLVGEGGCILHAGDCALRLLGKGLSLRDGRLTGPSKAATGSLDSLVAQALRGDPPAQGLMLQARGRRYLVRALPFRPGQGSGNQLLKAVVLLDSLS